MLLLFFFFFCLVNIPNFHNRSCDCCFRSRKNVLPRLRVISCLLTVNYCSVTCECSFPCCEVVQRLCYSYTPLIFSCWEAGLWLLGSPASFELSWCSGRLQIPRAGLQWPCTNHLHGYRLPASTLTACFVADLSNTAFIPPFTQN